MPSSATPPWMADAACRGMGLDVFFVGPGNNAREAKKVCWRCPVRSECLEYAMGPPIVRDGVWGGLGERERRREAKRRRLARQRRAS